MLIAFAGLPGTGKTTLSRRLAATIGAVYLRVDAIEQAIRQSGIAATEVGPAGYVVAQALAGSNLELGQTIVVDCVNPVHASRQAWRDIARRAGTPLIEIEILCSDRDQHRRRVEARAADLPGHVLPTWDEVMRHRYEPWIEPHATLDTASIDPDEAMSRIRAIIDAARGALDR